MCVDIHAGVTSQVAQLRAAPALQHVGGGTGEREIVLKVACVELGDLAARAAAATGSRGKARSFKGKKQRKKWLQELHAEVHLLAGGPETEGGAGGLCLPVILSRRDFDGAGKCHAAP